MTHTENCTCKDCFIKKLRGEMPRLNKEKHLWNCVCRTCLLKAYPPAKVYKKLTSNCLTCGNKMELNDKGYKGANCDICQQSKYDSNSEGVLAHGPKGL